MNDPTFSNKVSVHKQLQQLEANVVNVDGSTILIDNIDVLSSTLATEATLSTLATEATVSTLATEATASTLATEATASTLATEATLSTLATEATVSTLATEATVSTLATEATASTLATEATVSTLATEATVSTLATEVTASAINVRLANVLDDNYYQHTDIVYYKNFKSKFKSGLTEKGIGNLTSTSIDYVGADIQLDDVTTAIDGHLGYKLSEWERLAEYDNWEYISTFDMTNSFSAADSNQANYTLFGIGKNLIAYSGFQESFFQLVITNKSNGAVASISAKAVNKIEESKWDNPQDIEALIIADPIRTFFIRWFRGQMKFGMIHIDGTRELFHTFQPLTNDHDVKNFGGFIFGVTRNPGTGTIEQAHGINLLDLTMLSWTTENKVSLDPNLLDNFGRLVTAELDPVFTYSFVNNVNSRVWSSAVTSTGQVGHNVLDETNYARLRLLNDANQTASELISIPSVQYKNGQTCEIITALYTEVPGGEHDIAATWGFGVHESDTGSPYSKSGAGFGLDKDGMFIWRSRWDPGVADTKIYSDAWLSFPRGFNSAKGNIYKVQITWLGFCCISYYILNPRSGEWVLVYVYRNLNVDTKTITRYNNYCALYKLHKQTAVSWGDTSTIYVTSVGLYSLGKHVSVFPVRHTFTRGTTLSAGTFKAYKIKTLYNSLDSFASADILDLEGSVVNTGNNTASILVYKNCTLTTVTWNDIDTNTSIIEESDVITAITLSDELVGVLNFGQTGQTSTSFQPGELTLYPGENVVFELILSGGTSTLTASAKWREDL